MVATSVGLWGGEIGGAVFLLLGLAEGFGKMIELGGLMRQQSALIASDVAAYGRCMANCLNRVNVRRVAYGGDFWGV